MKHVELRLYPQFQCCECNDLLGETIEGWSVRLFHADSSNKCSKTNKTYRLPLSVIQTAMVEEVDDGA